MSAVKVTFALIAYNQQEHVRQAIEGAFCQTYEPLEIILSDDCSTDRTFQIMQEMTAAYHGPHTVVVRRNASNLGLAGHMNSVVAAASAGIVAWAAGDDISLPDRVSATVQPLLDDSEVMGVHSSVTEIDLKGNLRKVREHPHLRNGFTLLNVVEGGFGVVSQAHIFRKRIFDKYGGFDAGLTNEGPVMAFRELLEGRIAYIPTSTVLYRVGSGVSTYAGGDLKKRTITEPQKIAGWSLTSTSQMLSDLDRASVRDDELAARLRERNRYWRGIYEINQKPFNLKPMLDLVGAGLFDKRAARAFLRRSSPMPLRWLYSRASAYRSSAS